MLSIKSKDYNYLAKIVQLSGVRKHSNADRLQCVAIDGQNVITGLDAKDGDYYVFFPVESAINKEFLSSTNSFEDKELNEDKECKGFFNKHGRVRAISLRSERSEGYIVPVDSFFAWVNKAIDKNVYFDKSMVGTEFDHINETQICCKYVPRTKNPNNCTDRSKKKIKSESKIVDGQFRLSEDTAHFKRNLHKFSPDDIITASYKIHGCNCSMGKVLCKRKLNIIEKIAKFLGAKVQETHYDLVFASRRVIKNSYADKQHESYYDTDVWGMIADRYKECLVDGITLYGEIAGQMPNGSWIQKDYDYGLPENHCDLFVYRITYTNMSGDVFEFTTNQVKNYCNKFGLKIVPIFYYGRAGDLFDISETEHWHENFLDKLIEKYTEKPCFMCKNKLPEEGIVIHQEKDFFEPYKLKSFAFLERESKELDSGVENIEDVN